MLFTYSLIIYRGINQGNFLHIWDLYCTHSCSYQ